MAVDDMLDDRKPEARAAALAAVFVAHAIKPFGQARQMVRGDANSIISDSKCDLPRALRQRQRDMAAGLAVLDGILGQVLHDLDEFVAIPHNRTGALHRW